MFSDNTYASDEENFYDAEEISTSSLPESARHSRLSQAVGGLYWRSSPNSQSSDEDLSKLEKLQKAEDELIERKKLAEKRLQKEEEDIQQRLEKIERKKQAEVRRQLMLDALAKQREERGKLEQEEEELVALEAESLAKENDMRRKKLLMLREKLYINHSRCQTPNSDNQLTATDGASLSERQTPAASLGEVFDDESLIAVQQKENSTVSSVLPLTLSANEGITSATLNTPHADAADNEGMLSLTALTADTRLALPQDEPDIVASSKTPILSCESSACPVAPPRKKRLPGKPSGSGIAEVTNLAADSPGPLALGSSNYSDQSSSCNSLRTVGTRLTSRAGLSTVDYMASAESEHSLNIKLATLGRSYVTTEDQCSKSADKSCRNAEEASTTARSPSSDFGDAPGSGHADKAGGTNPLSLHIMQLTKDYGRDSSISHESDDSQKSTLHVAQQAIRKGGAQLKNLVGKTIEKLKSVADEVLQREEPTAVEDEDGLDGLSQSKKLTSCNHKGRQDFENVHLVQTFYGEHTGPVWTMKFSPCGRLLASGGQDAVVRVWALRDAYAYFADMRHKYSDTKHSSAAAAESAPSGAEESLTSLSNELVQNVSTPEAAATASPPPSTELPSPRDTPFLTFGSYQGHTGDILDLSWSKNYFLLSSSMDKTVRLWHMSRGECLCCFQHVDFVTAIVFHPRDDRYFLSGSLDGKLRLWSIPEKKVALWNEVAGPIRLITAANFCQNGKFAVIGTYDGRCIFYTTEQLKYFTLINVKSSRGKNAKGHKITAIEPMPNEDKILVTSNDSRLRLYDLRDLTLTCKYKGCTNTSSQIKAGFSNDGRFIVCGSEDCSIYIWKTYYDFQKFSSARRDRNVYWESIKAHDAVVTATVFAPQPNLFFSGNRSASLKSAGDKSDEGLKLPVEVRCSNSLRSSGGKGGSSTGTRGKGGSLQKSGSSERHLGEVLVTADYIGTIKVLVKPNEPERSNK